METLNLEQALSFANYQTVLNQQRQQLKQKFLTDCIIAYNGGLFKISPEFILSVQNLGSNWVLDLNNNPVLIEDLSNFVTVAKDSYQSAIETYGQSYQKLKTKRNVKALVDL